MAESTASVTWKGSLLEGGGTIDHVGSGVFGDLPITWKARTGEEGGKTTPEELIAAAHASCYSMALSHALAQDGNAPDSLETSATVTFVPGAGITKIALSVKGSVPGIDQAAFVAAAEDAKANCPVSKALAAVHEITVEALLS